MKEGATDRDSRNNTGDSFDLDFIAVRFPSLVALSDVTSARKSQTKEEIVSPTAAVLQEV
jgi:hypothetical protein